MPRPLIYNGFSSVIMRELVSMLSRIMVFRILPLTIGYWLCFNATTTLYHSDNALFVCAPALLALALITGVSRRHRFHPFLHRRTVELVRSSQT